MFSGIIETTSKIISLTPQDKVVKLKISKPQEFQDIANGHSVAVNGACLTIERFDDQTMEFVLGPETLEVTRWGHILSVGQTLNVERSLKLGDRIHGHLVTGHVDSMGSVTEIVDMNQTRILKVRMEKPKRVYVWTKGSMAINGVSLTINSVMNDEVEFCLIPETLRRTNLEKLQVGEIVTIEYDYLAKTFLQKSKDEYARHI